jgi:hypothetical protein
MRTPVVVGGDAAEVLSENLVAFLAPHRQNASGRHIRLAAVGLRVAKHAVVPLLPGPQHELRVQNVLAHGLGRVANLPCDAHHIVDDATDFEVLGARKNEKTLTHIAS